MPDSVRFGRYLALLVLLFPLFSVGGFAAPLSNAQIFRRAWTLMTPVSGFTLVNADNGKEIAGFNPIREGAAIDLALLPARNITIRANVSRIATSFVRRVQLSLNDKSPGRIDGVRPYSLTKSNGASFAPWKPSPGQYSLRARAYRTAAGLRAGSLDKSLTFSIIDSGGASPNPTATPPSGNPPGLNPQPSPTVPPALPAIPEIEAWQENMVFFGNLHCGILGDPGTDFNTKLLWTYYDAQHVFTQIKEYTGAASFQTCAERAESVYRDQYVGVYSGFVPGYWNFTHGLRDSYLKTGDTTSRNELIELAQNAAFARDSTLVGETQPMEASRETSYAIHAYLNAEEVGEPRRARLSLLVNHALGHLDQWFVSRTAAYVRPFMVGITAHALISYADKVGDARILPALINAADEMWDELWVESSLAFRYTDRLINNGDLDPAPDLNLLIAPMYAWLYHKTGEERFLTRGDKIFKGGVLGSYLYNGKQFNQSYRWSFEYVRLRSLQPEE